MGIEKQEHALVQCVYEATLACNLRCRHCGSSAGKARYDELSTSEAADLFQQLAQLGCRKVTISGGEATLRPDFLELVAAAKAAGLRTSVITNAVCWTESFARQAQAAGLESVGLSVDGLGAVHDQIRGRAGHFETLLEAMRINVALGLPWAAITFVCNHNLELLPQMYDLLAKRGAFAWQVQLGTDMGNMRSNRDLLVEPRKLPRLDAILSQLVRRRPVRIDVSDSIGYYGPHEALLRSSALRHKRRRTFGGCAAGTRVLGIESNGNVKGCLSILAGYSEHGDSYVEGNIRERSLADIWNDPNAFAYNRQWSVDQLGGFCRQCRHAQQCRGGCYGKRVGAGDPSDNPLCLYRVLCETAQHSPSRMGQAAAAALLATTLTGAGCHKAEDPEPQPDYSDPHTDIGTESETTAQESDTPAYADPSTDPVQTVYSDPTPTDETVADYSDPTTEQTAYGDPWTDPLPTADPSTEPNGTDYSAPWTDEMTTDYSDPGLDSDTDTDDGPYPVVAKRPKTPTKPTH